MGRQDGQQIRLGNAVEPVFSVLFMQQFQNITKILSFCFLSTPGITIVFTSGYTILYWQQWPPVCI